MVLNKNILVVEDDPDIRELITFNLSNNGYKTHEAINGELGIEKARESTPDLVLLDLMLPGIQGLDVCRIIKSDQNTKEIPIIMVSALGQEEDVVKGLETGADDYITKPFGVKVLLARIEAVLRRSLGSNGDDSEKSISIAGISIKPRLREVKVDDVIIENLTFSEFQILYLLASHPGWVFTRYQIIDKIRGDNYPVTDRSVDFQIVGLRKKLGKAGKLIKTVRGVGYRFIQPDEK